MITRISVKVMLAWSTCAQMGFMLLQCGLGAWQMALLHLVAHSLYKAHAFLSAGGAVRRAMDRQLAPPVAPPTAVSLAAGAVLGLGMSWLAGSLFGVLVPEHTGSAVSWVLAGILALALVPLVQGQALRLGGLWLPLLGLGAFGVALAYFAGHTLFSAWLPGGAAGQVPAPMPAPALWLGVALAFAALFILQSILTVAPQGVVARRLYPLFYGGLFLDEAFNRLAFALWRPPGPRAAAARLPAADPATRPRSPPRRCRSPCMNAVVDVSLLQAQRLSRPSRRGDGACGAHLAAGPAHRRQPLLGLGREPGGRGRGRPGYAGGHAADDAA